jgi:hypothetical protein
MGGEDEVTAMLTEESPTIVHQHVTTDQPEQASHIVMVPPEEEDSTPQAYVLRARIEGFPVTALCGHTFVPQKNPEPLPVCEECLEIFQHDPNGHGDREELPEA